MKTQIYTVVFSANKPHSDYEGYTNGYEAFDQSGYKWAILNSPGEHKVLEKQVRCELGTGACMKLRKGQTNGEPESWLLSESS